MKQFVVLCSKILWSNFKHDNIELFYNFDSILNLINFVKNI